MNMVYAKPFTPNALKQTIHHRREFAYKKEKMKIEKKLLVKKEPKNKNDESFKN